MTSCPVGRLVSECEAMRVRHSDIMSSRFVNTGLQMLRTLLLLGIEHSRRDLSPV